MATYWRYNSKTGEISSYEEPGRLADAPGQEWLVWCEYLTSGFLTRESAEAYSREHGACSNCKSSRRPNERGHCWLCGFPVTSATPTP